MSAAVAAPPASNGNSSRASENQGTRETVESIIVAFILAFLFRAFVAEAFVIPTGSMAPTLMGAHKDIYCEYCGQQYQASASSEFDSNTGALREVVTIASTCSTCRGLNAYDFRNNRNHASFDGDRILVSKFDYVFSRPKRWDVFVFKFPTEARMNYIKRLVGLPGETLLIDEGDVYTRTKDSPEWTIARKPPNKIRAMRQIVSDTNYQADVLIEQGWPSLWQPSPGERGWTVAQDKENWSAKLSNAPSTQWLRYYHKFLDDASWRNILSGQSLPDIDPYASQLVTDYLAYNSSYHWNRKRLYDGNKLDKDIDGDTRALDLAIRQGLQLEGGGVKENDGYHWVGDLVSEFEVEIESDSGTLLLDLVEFGIHFQCAIDVASGAATLQAVADTALSGIFEGTDKCTAQTSIRGRGSYRLELANVDDQIVLWVNGKVIEFDSPTTFDSRQARAGKARRPYWTAEDPLDAAPAGIAGQALEMQVTRAKIYRDIYYIAIQGGGYTSEGYSDYDLDLNGSPLLSAIPDTSLRRTVNSPAEVLALVYSTPEWWSETNLFSLRGKREFELEDDQYFPMGDNSAASSDARAWYGRHYVDEKFLLGKALLVFWPHTWNTPVPFTPNFSRMGLIR